MGLGQFQADRPAADDDQSSWDIGLFRDRLVGHMGRVRQPFDGRREGRGPGGDNEPPGRDPVAGGRFDLVGRRETPRFRDNPNAQALETLHRVHRFDRLYHRFHMTEDPNGIDLVDAGVHPEIRGFPDGPNGMGRRDQAFDGTQP